MAIKILRRELAVVGRIKIGGLETEKRVSKNGKEWQAPVKYDHFQIKSMVRGADGNFLLDEALQRKIGDKPTELEIMLLYNDNELNFRTELAYYHGRKCICRGDGECAQRIDHNTKVISEVKCKCELLEKSPGCKPHGTLYCILKDAEIAGGVWKFSTTSWNTIQNIQSSLEFINLCTGGKMAGIPLIMRLYQKDTFTPDGSPTKIWIVGLFYKGSPVQMLDSAIQNEKRRLEGGVKLELLEYQVRAQIQNQIKSFDEVGPTDPDEIDEFHPEYEVEKPSIKDVLADAGQRKADTTPGVIEDAKVIKTEQAKKSEQPAETKSSAKAKPVSESQPQTEPEQKPETQPATEAEQQKPSAKTKADLLKDIAAIRTRAGISTAQFVVLVGSVPGCKANTDSKLWTDEQTAAILEKLSNKYSAKAGATA